MDWAEEKDRGRQPPRVDQQTRMGCFSYYTPIEDALELIRDDGWFNKNIHRAPIAHADKTTPVSSMEERLKVGRLRPIPVKKRCREPTDSDIGPTPLAQLAECQISDGKLGVPQRAVASLSTVQYPVVEVLHQQTRGQIRDPPHTHYDSRCSREYEGTLQAHYTVADAHVA
jgi:hypothetical protein